MRAGSLIAVTGGTGFVGRRFVADALGSGYKVRLLTRDEGAAGADVEFRRFDLFSKDPLDPDVLEGCDALVHLAAYIPKNQECPAEAAKCMDANGLGTLRLLLAAEQAEVGRFAQTTSANGYCPQVRFPNETSPMFPSHRAPFYLTSQIAQEVYGEYWRNRRSMSVTTARLSSVYGEGQASGVIPFFASSLLAKKQISLANRGRFGADFVWVGDVSSALLLFLRNDVEGIYNVASGVRSTMMELATLLVNFTGADNSCLEVLPEEPGAHEGFSAVDVSRARARGYLPISVEEGLAMQVQWMRQLG